MNRSHYADLSWCFARNSLIYWQIFQHLPNDKANTPALPSMHSTSEARTAPPKGIHLEARSGDHSAATGASILASLSAYKKDRMVLPPLARNGKSVYQGIEGTIFTYCNASYSSNPDHDATYHVRNCGMGITGVQGFFLVMLLIVYSSCHQEIL